MDRTVFLAELGEQLAECGTTVGFFIEIRAQAQ
jgi:hypothetical protein